MRKILTISLVVLMLTATYSFAQMGGGGKMEGQQSGMEHGQVMQHKGMMEHGQMMGDMMGMTNQMSDMIRLGNL